MEGILGATLLRRSPETLGTVDGGGVGRRGCATVRVGGDRGGLTVVGGGVLDVGSSGTDSGSSWARAELDAADRRVGMWDTRLDVDDCGGRGLVRLLMTSSHSLIGLSWLMRTGGFSRSPLFLRCRSSVMWRWILCLESWRWTSLVELSAYVTAILSS